MKFDNMPWTLRRCWNKLHKIWHTEESVGREEGVPSESYLRVARILRVVGSGLVEIEAGGAG